MPYKKIDMAKLRDALPKRAVIVLTRKELDGKKLPALVCKVAEPHLNEEEFEMVKQWQRNIMGNKNIAGIFVDTQGHDWCVYLEAAEYEFINMNEADKRTYKP